MTRLKSKERWKKSLYDLAIWFMAGIVVTTMARLHTPGYPIIVGTESIQTGIYWLDKTTVTIDRGDYVTFPFRPPQEWLIERFGANRVHTKLVRGIEGDTVKVAQDASISICHAPTNYRTPGPETDCWSAGSPLAVDSKGRPMKRWLEPGQSYTLKSGELWVYGPHEKSLDSRYQGPVPVSILHGEAKPLFLLSK